MEIIAAGRAGSGLSGRRACPTPTPEPSQSLREERGAAMATTVNRTGFAQTTGWTRRVFSVLERYWGAFQNWRKREKLRADLCSLNDNELQDIGVARRD